MRTTLVLDDEVYEAARRRAFEQRRSLGAVISELAGRGLEAEVGAAARAEPPAIRLGAWAGKVWIADDFDDTPQEWLDAIEEPIDPRER